VKYYDHIDVDPVEQRHFTMRLKELGYTIKKPKHYSTLCGYSLKGERLRELLERLHSEGELGNSPSCVLRSCSKFRGDLRRVLKSLKNSKV
jgi:hypothetical protein